MQSNAINLLSMISQKTHFLENWTNQKNDPLPPRRNSFNLRVKESCQQINRSYSKLVKLKKQRKQPQCRTTNSIIFLDRSIKLKASEAKRNLAPIIRHKFYPKNLASSFVGKRYHDQHNDSTWNTINLFDCVANKNKTNQFQECTFSNTKIMESLHEEKKSPHKSGESKVHRKKILCSFNRYFQSCFLNAHNKRNKFKSGPIEKSPENELKSTKMKCMGNGNLISLRKKRLSLDIL